MPNTNCINQGKITWPKCDTKATTKTRVTQLSEKHQHYHSEHCNFIASTLCTDGQVIFRNESHCK